MRRLRYGLVVLVCRLLRHPDTTIQYPHRTLVRCPCGRVEMITRSFGI